jgi:hypothetical protein
MLYRKTVAVYCENHTDTQIQSVGRMQNFNIVMYRGGRLVTIGSELDDGIYWLLFTITINYNSSQSMTLYDSLHSLLDYECLPFCVNDLV